MKKGVIDPAGQAAEAAELQQRYTDLKKKEITIGELRAEMEKKQLEEAMKKRSVTIHMRDPSASIKEISNVESIQAAGNFVSVYHRENGNMLVVRYPYDLVDSIEEIFED